MCLPGGQTTVSGANIFLYTDLLPRRCLLRRDVEQTLWNYTVRKLFLCFKSKPQVLDDPRGV
jgi:hypothetical protein